jgi:hypothetical protein
MKQIDRHAIDFALWRADNTDPHGVARIQRACPTQCVQNSRIPVVADSSRIKSDRTAARCVSR